MFPLEVETSYLQLNKRYYALSALSFRRYVLGSMYARVKSANILGQDAKEFQEFLDVYNRILYEYETRVVPHLVDADI